MRDPNSSSNNNHRLRPLCGSTCLCLLLRDPNSSSNNHHYMAIMRVNLLVSFCVILTATTTTTTTVYGHYAGQPAYVSSCVTLTAAATTTILQPLCGSTRVSRHLQLITGGFCWCLQCLDAVGWAAGKACKKTEWWGAGVVICVEQGADLHMAQLMPLPLTVSCFSKIQ